MPFKVIDTRTPTNVLQVSAEAHTFSVGAAGTVVIFRIDKRPILNSTYTGIGALGDTSFTWTTGTVFTTEVLFDKSMINNLTTFAATLANGEYAIDYNNGLFIGKKATTGTSDSCNYYTEQLNSEVTVSATIGDLNYTKIKGVAVSTEDGNVDTGTQRITLATDDIPIALINTNLGDIETDIEATNTALGTIETDIEATNTALGDGSQKTQIVDGSGNVIGATSNALDINVKSGSVTVTATDLDIRNLTATDVVTTQGQVKLGGKFITPTCPITVPATYNSEAISQFSHAGKVTTTTANKVYDLGIPAGIIDGTNLGMMYELVISMNDYANATGTDASTIIKIYRENTVDGNDPTTSAIDEEVFIAPSVVIIPLVHSWALTKILMTSSTGALTFNYRVRGAYYTPAV